MDKGFNVDGNYSGYTFVGSQYGEFTSNGGDRVNYANIFVITPGESSKDHHADGFKAEKFKCISPDVWSDLKPGDKIRCFFDNRQRVQMVAHDG